MREVLKCGGRKTNVAWNDVMKISGISRLKCLNCNQELSPELYRKQWTANCFELKQKKKFISLRWQGFGKEWLDMGFWFGEGKGKRGMKTEWATTTMTKISTKWANKRQTFLPRKLRRERVNVKDQLAEKKVRLNRARWEWFMKKKRENNERLVENREDV